MAKWHPDSQLPEIDDSLHDVFDDEVNEAPLREPPLATRLHRERGCAVVCNCPPKNGLQSSAQLTIHGDFWICVQRPDCGFTLKVADTKSAPRPKKSSGLIAEPPPAVTRKSWQIAADDCGLMSEEMDVMQISDFREFLNWYNGQSSERLTRDGFAGQWALFAESKSVASAA